MASRDESEFEQDWMPISGRPNKKLLFPHRIHFYEINDQSWWPDILREKVQDALTLAWINKFPVLQPTAPSDLVARILSSILGNSISDFVYVDFASGAGGPTPFIEHKLNKQLQAEGKQEVKFVLSDISPHIPAWTTAAKKSENLSFISTSVDATAAPPAQILLQDVPNMQDKKVMRLFSLAFHHFDDEMAADVLQNTVETSDGFSIFELQGRYFSSLLTVTCLWPMLMLMSPFYYLHDPVYMFFTYLVPWVPFVIVFDGYISMLRTRTPEEVYSLMRKRLPEEELANWRFVSGWAQHTWPMGWLNWIICYKVTKSTQPAELTSAKRKDKR